MLSKGRALLGAALAGDSEAYSYLTQSVDEFLSARQLVAAMEDAGLRDVWQRSLGMGMVAVVVGEVGQPIDALTQEVSFPAGTGSAGVAGFEDQRK